MRRLLGLAMWLGWLCLGAQTSHAAVPDAALRRIIDWMPEDVETIAVARGSLRLPKKPVGTGALNSPAATSTPAPVFWSAAALPTDYVIGCAPGEILQLAMEGRRHFRPPAGLGLMRYEGCAVYQLAPTMRTTQARLTTNILKLAKSRTRVEATDVGVYSKRFEQDNWTFYVCSPAPNLVLVATDRSFLKTVLTRLATPDPADAIAFPLKWQDWPSVNTAAPFWAVRRLGAGFGPLLVSRPDPTARFLTVSLSGQELVWHYAGKSREVVKSIAEIIGRETKLPTKTAVLRSGFQACRIDLRKAGESQIGYLSFFLLGFIGPAIFL